MLINHEQVVKIVRESKSATNKLAGAVGDVDGVLDKIIKKRVDLSGLFNGVDNAFRASLDTVELIKSDVDTLISNLSGNVFDAELHFNPITGQLDAEVSKIQKMLDDELQNQYEALGLFFTQNEKLQTNLIRSIAAQKIEPSIKFDIDTGQIETANGLLQRGTQQYESIISKLDEIAAIDNIGDQVTKNFKEITELLSLGNSLTSEQRQRLDALISPLDIATKMMVEQVSLRAEEIQLSGHQLQLEKNRMDILMKYSRQLYVAEGIINEIGDSFDYINAILPRGVGELMGLSKVSQNLRDIHRSGVKKFAEDLDAGVAPAEALSGYMKSFKPALTQLITPMNAVIGGLLLAKIYVDGITEKMKEMTSEMKTSLTQSMKLLNVQFDILTSQKNQFMTMQDIKEIQSEMIGTSGRLSNIDSKPAKDLVIQLGEMSKAFGYTNAEAVQMHKIFERLGADNELSKRLQADLGIMSEMGGLSPQIVGRDLIESADIVATYFAGMPKQAAQAAIQVRKLGLSLQQAGSIAQKMLDLEGFMTDMYELNAMSNRGIDFSRAFEFGLQGDIPRMTEEIMSNIGSVSEFNKIDYLTRQKLAKTLGMSMDDLSKSVMLHEKMSTLTSEEGKYLQANLDKMGDISNSSQDEIRSRLQMLQSTDKLNVAWDKIKGVLIKSLLPLVEIFANVLEGISPLLDIIIFGVKAVGAAFKVVLDIVSVLTKPIKWLGDLLSIGTEKMDELGDSSSKLNPVLSGILKLASGIVTIFAAKKAFSFFSGLTGAAGNLIKMIPGIGTAMEKISAPKTMISAAPAHVDIIPKVAPGAVAKVISNQGPVEVPTNTPTASNKIKEIGDLSKATITETERVSKKSKGEIDSVSKSASKSIRTSLMKDSFSSLTSIGVKSFALIGAAGALELLTAEDDAASGMNVLKTAGIGAFGMIASSGSSLLIDKIGDAISNLFTKNLGKTAGDGFDAASKIGTSKIGRLSSTIGQIFNPLKSFAGSAFDAVVNAGKQIFPSIGKSGKLTFDGMVGASSVASKEITDNLSKVNPAQSIVDVTSNIQENVQKINETIDSAKQIQESTPISNKSKSPDVDVKKSSKTLSQTKNSFQTGFDSISSAIKTIWKGIKGTLIEIVDFSMTVLKKLGAGIGQTIEKLLTSLARGLSKFSTNSIKGAAALVILSGAIWTTSKALTNFAKVQWADIAKGLISIGGLTLAAITLGKASGQMIIGAIAIATLGAALIPAAYALNQFNSVDWSSLAKAGVAISGLAIIGSVISPLVPIMLVGAVGIAALGASIIPLAYGLNMLSNVKWDSLVNGPLILSKFAISAITISSIAPALALTGLALVMFSTTITAATRSLTEFMVIVDNIDVTGIDLVAKSIQSISSISVSNIVGLSSALLSLSAAFMTFNASQMLSKPIALISGDPFKKLKEIADLADPIAVISKSISALVDNLQLLADVITEIPIDRLSTIPTIKNKIVEGQANSPTLTADEFVTNTDRVSVSRNLQPTVKRPNPKSVAQDVRITSPKSAASDELYNRDIDNYNSVPTNITSDNRRTEILLQQIVSLLSAFVNRPVEVNLGMQHLSKMHTTMKSFNNNR